MKILHLVTDLIRGGSEGQCARTVLGLQWRGINNRVAVMFRQGFFLQAVEAACGEVMVLEGSWPKGAVPGSGLMRRVTGLPRFIRWMKEESFDLVHAWDTEGALFGAYAARKAGLPFINSRRDLGQIYPAWKTCLLHRADRQAIAVVANARAIARHFAGPGLPDSKIHVIGNILDLEEFDRLSKKEGPSIRAETESWAMICVARLDLEKDHAMMLRAWGNARRSLPEGARLHLVGDGVERERLESLAGHLELGTSVAFHGDRSEIPSLLRQMDAGLLTPSVNEGLSNTILEYMAAGLPVIATDCGGNRELVEGADCGFIVQPGDVKACARAILQLANTRGHPYGSRGRHFVETRHTPEKILAAFEALYGSCV